MNIDLPSPTPDRKAYQDKLQRGLARYPGRAENFARVKQQERAQVTACSPIVMDFEVTSRCNYRCVMCLVSEWPGGKRADDMPYEAFTRLLDELYGLVEIKLQGIGEPLLNPRIFDMISLADDRDIWSRLTVNASLLHLNDNYKKLIDSNPGEVQISIDGATRDVFEQIRRGSDFDTVVRNSILLTGYEQKQNVIKTRAWTTVQKYNLHQLPDIVRLAASMQFKRLTFALALSCFGTQAGKRKNLPLDASSEVDYDMALELLALGDSYGIEVTFWDANKKFELNGDASRRCPWPWERAFVSSDLRVVPCCVLSTPATADFGDAMIFSEVWNNGQYQQLRNQHLTGDIPLFCKQCYGHLK